MEKLFIKELSIANENGLNTVFNIPMEYKKVKGVFITRATSNLILAMQLKINGKEITSNLFDPELIRYNGYLSRKELALEMDEPGLNSRVEANFSIKGGDTYPLALNMYFIVE